MCARSANKGSAHMSLLLGLRDKQQALQSSTANRVQSHMLEATRMMTNALDDVGKTLPDSPDNVSAAQLCKSGENILKVPKAIALASSLESLKQVCAEHRPCALPGLVLLLASSMGVVEVESEISGEQSVLPMHASHRGSCETSFSFLKLPSLLQNPRKHLPSLEPPHTSQPERFNARRSSQQNSRSSMVERTCLD